MDTEELKRLIIDIRHARRLCRKGEAILSINKLRNKSFIDERINAACRLSRIYLGECEGKDIEELLNKARDEFTYSAACILPNCLRIYRKKTRRYLKIIKGPRIFRRIPLPEEKELICETETVLDDIENYIKLTSQYNPKKLQFKTTTFTSGNKKLINSGYKALEKITEKQPELRISASKQRDKTASIYYKLAVIVAPIAAVIIGYFLTKYLR